METDNPEYYNRYVSETNRTDDPSRLQQYLESLRGHDWEGFFADVVRGHARAIMMIQPNHSDELTAKTEVYLERLSNDTQEEAAGALQDLIDNQLSGSGHQFSVDEARALFWLASSLTTGVHVERFASIANNGDVNTAYRAEAGRVILNHADDDLKYKKLWMSFDLKSVPALAPVVLLGLAKYGAADAIGHIAPHCEDPPNPTAMWLAFRDVLLDCLRDEGVPGLYRAIRQIGTNSFLTDALDKLQNDYDVLKLDGHATRRVVKDVYEALRRECGDSSHFSLDFENSELKDIFKATEDTFSQMEATSDAVPALLATLRGLFEGPEDVEDEFLSRVSAQMLKLKDHTLPSHAD